MTLAISFKTEGVAFGHETDHHGETQWDVDATVVEIRRILNDIMRKISSEYDGCEISGSILDEQDNLVGTWVLK